MPFPRTVQPASPLMPESFKGTRLDNRHSLRREMRRCRRALSPRQQEQAAHRLDRLLARQPLFQRSRHIAFYSASDGEIDPFPLLSTALRRGKRCYLPVLHPGQANSLWFLPFNATMPLVTNRFGIPEPAVNSGRAMPAAELDLVLLPLVAFDHSGARLGMGAGFYDRTFALKASQKGCNPVLMGLAHSCQAAEQLPVQPWDIPLRAVATESGIVACGDTATGRDFLGRDLLTEKPRGKHGA